jgi:hypothetical protein
MMRGEAPETCWATRKRQVTNLWNCCILLVDLFESYDDAQTCERQTKTQPSILVVLFKNLLTINLLKSVHQQKHKQDQ